MNAMQISGGMTPREREVPVAWASRPRFGGAPRTHTDEHGPARTGAHFAAFPFRAAAFLAAILFTLLVLSPVRAAAADAPAKRSYAFIGVSMGPVSGGLADRYKLEGDKRSGVLVNQVIPDSPAQKAGLKTGDVIHAVDGAPVRTPAELLEAIAFKQIGVDVTLDVSRPKPGYKGSDPIQATMAVAERKDGVDVGEALDRMKNPEAYALPFPGATPEPVGADPLAIGGLSLGPASSDGSAPGLRVFSVVPNSEAAMGGFFQGDLILKINGRDVNTRAETLSALDAADPKKPVEVQFQRDGKLRKIRWSLTLPLPKAEPTPAVLSPIQLINSAPTPPPADKPPAQK